jgi:hypothetical protein
MNSPNELLDEVRRCTDRVLRLSDRGNNLHVASSMVSAAAELAEAMDALDEWLISGGALPVDWNVQQPRYADVECWDLPREEFQDIGGRFTRLIPDYKQDRAQRRRSR